MREISAGVIKGTFRNRITNVVTREVDAPQIRAIPDIAPNAWPDVRSIVAETAKYMGKKHVILPDTFILTEEFAITDVSGFPPITVETMC
ncbi:hypothetical protein COU76_05380 [Candidatus Peregrinibacteria bacterium CG10_big_fil_rev_8_21_14_0_10_49_10]|nr:MAG: hypothetical protein COU76_05380 [Candidatus Peregrinibacteria bacterium CG10_big_fil_rev_8_21_14_0_10_49_10]